MELKELLRRQTEWRIRQSFVYSGNSVSDQLIMTKISNIQALGCNVTNINTPVTHPIYGPICIRNNGYVGQQTNCQLCTKINNTRQIVDRTVSEKCVPLTINGLPTHL